MKQYEEKEIVNKETKYIETEICCNKCGETLKLTDSEMRQEWAKAKFQEFYLSFGYGSNYDNERWSFDLCENCLTELVKTFIWSPNGFGEDGYIAHDQQLTFEHWKETGEIDLEVGMTPEEIEERGGSIYGEFVEYEGENH